ncbi:conserved hypothetical protein, unlikely [Trypanosoma brucei gambiense DAL972]|uniref:Transmembrane protein n=2 Tax=Trypanosoma brucei TaxID=5691 RepID=Q38FS9_TRYB2|nr:conserved hypothetical protein, unlikely [Trypanosoma brucei gambiense DAL972]XP_803547.1 hypothetical protein, unlikely [Trypanosoma brucei brucei TREU927]EAN76341.1 hypothetical protein, unlikely [Trypanosoma brucei brucei TREU927]CBH14027.1 conserved hypothetical protein, unlikely [Trypanosoma brucei gambiense DAL972]|eukprot:XP_011776298.1 conserved hypothetical protein, unlikely [Trypanosoma brucei gambiense DAL972]
MEFQSDDGRKSCATMSSAGAGCGLQTRRRVGLAAVRFGLCGVFNVVVVLCVYPCYIIFSSFPFFSNLTTPLNDALWVVYSILLFFFRCLLVNNVMPCSVFLLFLP